MMITLAWRSGWKESRTEYKPGCFWVWGERSLSILSTMMSKMPRGAKRGLPRKVDSWAERLVVPVYDGSLLFRPLYE